MAAEFADYVRVLSSGCIACELLNDFDFFLEKNRETLGGSFDQAQTTTIAKLERAPAAISATDQECYNNEVLTWPPWDAARTAARKALATFEWAEGLPPEFTETAPGVWRRAP